MLHWSKICLNLSPHSEEKLKSTAELAGFDYAEVLHGSVETAYQAVYDVTEEEIDGWEAIKFVSVPKWLSLKAK